MNTIDISEPYTQPNGRKESIKPEDNRQIKQKTLSTKSVFWIPPSKIRAFRRMTLRLLNRERRKRRLSPLRLNGKLNRMAQDHTDRMAKRRSLYHNPHMTREAARAGYKWRALGENIAYVTWTGSYWAAARRMVYLWMRSTSHRENILRPDYVHLGVGVSRSFDELIWSTNNFGTPI